MGDLSDIFRTDNFDDVLAALSSADNYTGYNALLSQSLYAAHRNAETISATKTLSDNDYPIQVITPSGTDRTVTLPAEAITNHPFFISCASGASYNVVVKDDSETTTYATLSAGKSTLILSNGARWEAQGGMQPGDPLTDLSSGSATDGQVPKALSGGIVWGDESGGGGGGYGTTEGRLTLESGVAVSTSDQTAKTTIYFTPYKGNVIMLYTGTVWITHNLSELSISVPSTTNTPFDIFIDYNSGTPQLQTVNWTNDTTRATALATQDGVLVQSGTASRKYIGTGRTTASNGQCEDSKTNRLLWNYYNRTTRDVYYSIGTVENWTYGTKAWRYANGNSNAKIGIVCGISEDVVNLTLLSSCTESNSQWGSVAIGENSTSPHSKCMRQGGGYDVGWYVFLSQLIVSPSAGYSYYTWLEWASGSSIKFYNYASDNQFRSGFTGTWRC